MSRVAVLGALLVLAPAAVVTFSPRPRDDGTARARLAAAVPQRVGERTGADDALDAGTLRLLRTDDWLNRTYRGGGGVPVTLTVVSSRRERKTVHPPEVCFTAQGWEIESHGRVALTAPGGEEVEAATLRLARGEDRMACLYWYVAGGEATASYVEQQWNVALGTLTGERPGSSMVRLVAQHTGPGGAGAMPGLEGALREFAVLVLPDLRQALR